MTVRSVNNWLVTTPETLIGPTDSGIGKQRILHGSACGSHGARILEAGRCAERTVE